MSDAEEGRSGGALIRVLLSLVLGGGFLYLAVRDLDLDPEAFSTHVEGAGAGALVVFSLAYLVVHLARLWRWYYLLRPLGQEDKGEAFAASAIGFAAIIILPLRLGELVRPLEISRRSETISMSAALGTVVVERVVDGLLITLLLFVALLTVETRGPMPAGMWSIGIIAGSIFSTTMVVLLLSWWKRAATVRILRKIGNRISARLTEKALGLLEGFLDGVSALGGGRDLIWFLLWTAVYWGVNGWSLTYLANAFGLGLTLWQGYTLLAVLVIGIMVPGGPGHLGTFEYFMHAALDVFVVVSAQESAVVAYMASVHVLQFVLQVGFGVPFWLASTWGVRGSSQEKPSVQRGEKFK